MTERELDAAGSPDCNNAFCLELCGMLSSLYRPSVTGKVAFVDKFANSDMPLH